MKIVKHSFDGVIVGAGGAGRDGGESVYLSSRPSRPLAHPHRRRDRRHRGAVDVLV